MRHTSILLILLCLILICLFQPAIALSDDGLISAGDYHTCAVNPDSTISCWGANDELQSIALEGTFTQVSAGSIHNCAVKTDSTIACWGNNDFGQGTVPDGTFTQVSAGFFHSCGVRTDSTVICWGDNDDGQSTAPVGTFTQVSTHTFHSCGVRTDSTVICWGDNGDGQSATPDGTFIQVSVGPRHSCGVKTDNTVFCWGYDGSGQSTVPPGTFTQVSAGEDFTCAIKTDSTITCWGDNGELQSDPPTGTFTQVSAGQYHACGVKTDNTFICWGNDLDNQLAPGIELLSNSGFEIDVEAPSNQPDQWNVRFKSFDRQKCNTDTVQLAFRGNCAYLFKGAAGENAKLIYNVNGVSQVFNQNDSLVVDFAYKTGASTPNLKVKLLVYYANPALPRGIERESITFPSQGKYAGLNLLPYRLRDGGILKIKLQFNNRAISGKIYIDSVRLQLHPTEPLR